MKPAVAITGRKEERKGPGCGFGGGGGGGKEFIEKKDGDTTGATSTW